MTDGSEDCEAERRVSSGRGVVVPVERDAQVREVGDVPAGACGGAVLQERRCPVRREGRIDERDGRPGDGSELDGNGVVEDAAAIREPGQIPSEDAEDARTARWRDGRIEPEDVGNDWSGEVLEARDDPGGDARHE